MSNQGLPALPIPKNLIWLRHGNGAVFLSNEPEHRLALMVAFSLMQEDGQHLIQKETRAAQA